MKKTNYKKKGNNVADPSTWSHSYASGVKQVDERYKKEVNKVDERKQPTN
tara:strand:- start:322 stop:471 length:150 start_codon:yes stop_codon:yes gene_type:complete